MLLMEPSALKHWVVAGISLVNRKSKLFILVIITSYRLQPVLLDDAPCFGNVALA